MAPPFVFNDLHYLFIYLTYESDLFQSRPYYTVKILNTDLSDISLVQTSIRDIGTPLEATFKLNTRFQDMEELFNTCIQSNNLKKLKSISWSWDGNSIHINIQRRIVQIHSNSLVFTERCHNALANVRLNKLEVNLSHS